MSNIVFSPNLYTNFFTCLLLERELLPVVRLGLAHLCLTACSEHLFLLALLILKIGGDGLSIFRLECSLPAALTRCVRKSCNEKRRSQPSKFTTALNYRNENMKMSANKVKICKGKSSRSSLANDDLRRSSWAAKELRHNEAVKFVLVFRQFSESSCTCCSALSRHMLRYRVRSE